MLYHFNYRISVFTSIVKNYACDKIPELYEIYVLGRKIRNGTGKSTWNGTGPARNAIRLILNEHSYYYKNYTDVEDIMKYYVGLDDSYPIHIKKVN